MAVIRVTELVCNVSDDPVVFGIVFPTDSEEVVARLIKDHVDTYGPHKATDIVMLPHEIEVP